MSHWAEVDENNIVIRVTTGSNDDPDEGYQWLIDNLGGRWIKTSYNARSNGFRNKYAGVGDLWDEERNAFIGPQPYPSWMLDNLGTWEPPTPYPVIIGSEWYSWNEETHSWKVQVM